MFTESPREGYRADPPRGYCLPAIRTNTSIRVKQRSRPGVTGAAWLWGQCGGRVRIQVRYFLLLDAGQAPAWWLPQGVGPFWHFSGAERASPPMMGPRQWEEWVVPYDGELMRRIHARGRVRAEPEEQR